MTQQTAAPAVQCICGRWLYTEESRARQRGPVCWAREHPGQPVARGGRSRPVTTPPGPRPPAMGGQLELDIPDPDRSVMTTQPDHQPDHPTTPRAALLEFADEIQDIHLLGIPGAAPAVVDAIVHMARERAQHLPDHPHVTETDATVVQAVEAWLQRVDERLALVSETMLTTYQAATAKQPSAVDPVRERALHAAAVRLQHQPYIPGAASEDVLDLARALEPYLRGDR